MNENIAKKRPRGRPPAKVKASARLPVVQVTNEQLSAYRATAEAKGVSFSQWVRDNLDQAVLESSGGVDGG